MFTCKNRILTAKIVIKLLNNPMICCFYYEVDVRSVILKLTLATFLSHVLSPLSLALYVCMTHTDIMLFSPDRMYYQN